MFPTFSQQIVEVKIGRYLKVSRESDECVAVTQCHTVMGGVTPGLGKKVTIVEEGAII